MLVSSLAVLAAIYIAGLVRLWRHAGYGRGIRPRDVLAFAAGWLALAVALSPPLDEWSDVWLAAHMVQHELLMIIAAPLMAISSPLVAMLWAAPAVVRYRAVDAFTTSRVRVLWRMVTSPLGAFLLYATALWAWHVPVLYDAALAHEPIHILQHVCFFGTAALFWWGIAHGRYGRVGYGAAVLYVFATAAHSGVLGALLTFSPRPWYPHYEAAHAAGLTSLEDQQLAGLLMWVPAGFAFVGGGLILFAAWMRESDRHTRYKPTMAAGSMVGKS